MKINQAVHRPAGSFQADEQLAERSKEAQGEGCSNEQHEKSGGQPENREKGKDPGGKDSSGSLA